MRTLCGILLAGALAAPALCNGVPRVQPPAHAAADLDQVLQGWETALKASTTFVAVVTRTETDAVTKKSVVTRGTIKLLRPDKLALTLDSTDESEVPERCVLENARLSMYVPGLRLLRIAELAAPRPGLNRPDWRPWDDFLGLTFGMPVTEAKVRYDLKLAGEDEHYFYLMMTPNTLAGRSSLNQGRLTLFRATYLPRQLELEMPNRDVTRWEYRPDPKATPVPADFEMKLPQGWRTERGALPEFLGGPPLREK